MSLFDDDDFEHLAPRGTARYTLSQVCVPRTNPDAVVLVVKHAGSSNGAYQSALMKAPRASGKEATKQRAALFARHVVTGWENVLDKAGKPIEYSPSAGLDLLTRLIESKRDDLVIGAMLFASDADNFRGPIADAGDLGNG